MGRLKRRTIRVHLQLVPASLQLDQVLAENPPDFKYKTDLFLHLIHLTVEIPARRGNLLREDGFVPFNAAILEKLDRSYRKHLNYLVDNGILIESPHYLSGQYSKGFKLSNTLCTEGMRWAELTDEKMIDKLSDRVMPLPSAERRYAHLARYLYDEEFTIDEDAAAQYSHDTYLSDKAAGMRNAFLKHHIRLLKIQYFKSCWRWFNCAGQDHRLHTNVTNMDKGLRKFLSYRGQRICVVDVKNSQPFLSVMVLRREYINLNSFILKTPLYIINNQSTYTLMLVEKAESSVSIDVYRYIQMVVNGDLYPYLIQEYEQKYGADYFGKDVGYDEKKRTLKNIIFGIMYARNSAPMKGRTLFKKLFPGVLQAFTWSKAGDHARLPIALQQMEADLILNKVCAELATEYPNLPIWPIHDAIATTEGNEQIVANAIRRVFSEQTGFEPQLGFELLCSDCDQQQAA